MPSAHYSVEEQAYFGNISLYIVKTVIVANLFQARETESMRMYGSRGMKDISFFIPYTSGNEKFRGDASYL